MRPRDRFFLLALGAVAVAAIAGGALYAAFRGGPATGGRCFTVTVPASMGGATIHRCGAAATLFCRAQHRTTLVGEACRRAGFVSLKS